MLIFTPRYVIAVFFAMIVMPFSRSRSIESMIRTGTVSFARKMPPCQSIASTRVVFPWSTWAMMATFRISGRVCMSVQSSRWGRRARQRTGSSGSAILDSILSTLAGLLPLPREIPALVPRGPRTSARRFQSNAMVPYADPFSGSRPTWHPLGITGGMRRRTVDMWPASIIRCPVTSAAWQRERHWLRRQSLAVAEGYLRALRCFDPPPPAAWPREVAAVVSLKRESERRYVAEHALDRRMRQRRIG